MMPVRLWEYICRIWRMHRKQHPNEPLPVVYPLVLYSGDKPYREPMDLIKMFAETDQDLAREVLYNPFQLIDLTQSKPEDFEQHRLLSLLVTAFRSRRNLETNLAELAELLFNAIHRGEIEFGDAIITYTTDGGELPTHEEFVAKVLEQLSGDKRRDMQTFSEHFTKKGEQLGLQKGRQEGRQEMVISMLNNGIDIDLVVKSSGLSREAIEELYIKQ